MDNEKTYYELHRDEILEKRRKFYKKNKLKLNEKSLLYYYENKDKWKDYSRKYYEQKQKNEKIDELIDINEELDKEIKRLDQRLHGRKNRIKQLKNQINFVSIDPDAKLIIRWNE